MYNISIILILKWDMVGGLFKIMWAARGLMSARFGPPTFLLLHMKDKIIYNYVISFIKFPDLESSCFCILFMYIILFSPRFFKTHQVYIDIMHKYMFSLILFYSIYTTLKTYSLHTHIFFLVCSYCSQNHILGAISFKTPCMYC